MSVPRLHPVPAKVSHPRAASGGARDLSDETTQELSAPAAPLVPPALSASTEEITARRPMTARGGPTRPARSHPAGVMRVRGTPVHGCAVLPANTFLDVNFNTFLSGGTAAQAAIVVGHSRGTRTPEGGFTRAYAGAMDPVTGERGVGSFGYRVRQGGAATPDAADVLWLKKLKDVTPAFEARARQAGLNANNALLAATFLELFTRSPATATGRGGFLDQLVPMAARGGPTWDNLLRACLDSHRDPVTGALDAAGLDETRLGEDLERRVLALAVALRAQGLAARVVPPVR